MIKNILIFLIVITGIAVWRVEVYYHPIRDYIEKKEVPLITNEGEDYQIVQVVGGLEVPWSIVFTSPTRILVSERSGSIRVVENGKLATTSLYTFPEVVSDGEEGLMSLAVHPYYRYNKFVYASYAYMKGRSMYVKVVRFKDIPDDKGNKISEITTIIDNIPGSKYHAGTRIAFGPDEKLYITTGDAGDKKEAQNLSSLSGKILRINDDGSIPPTNPLVNSAIWSFGHRNPQGLAFSPNGTLYETEHGPSVFDGPPGGDEVNIIQKGGNYGWPIISHERTKDGVVTPILVYGAKAEAPGSLMYYSGKLFTTWKGNLFFGALGGEGLMRIILDEKGQKVVSYGKFADIKLGRIREVVEGPTGEIYFTTSNQDGRGLAGALPDGIYRIEKKPQPKTTTPAKKKK